MVEEFVNKYRGYLTTLLNNIDAVRVHDVINCFLEARRNNKTIYFAGNGGSAATASHFAQDLDEVGRKITGMGFRTQSINDNVAALTAIGNDYGYENIFSMQIQYNFNPGDVLVVISASGNSPNVVNAVKLAKEKGGTTVGLVGFTGGKLAGLCDHLIHIKSEIGEYGPVEDLHLVLDHMITSYFIAALKGETDER
ncbi:MAG: SIS domain-containing protein [Candidatus Omnitrophica bacterium]|nr:SIS domain-containing protein [Candidatus Omnitrophota bacterium]